MTNNLSIEESLNRLRKLKSGGHVEKAVHDVYLPLKREKKVNDFQLTKELLWKLFKYYTPPKYVIDSRNEQVLYTIMRYFLQDPEFNEYGKVKNVASVDKGLLIYGSYGVGKSLLFDTLHKVGRELITKAGCNDIWFNCISAGSFVDRYMNAAKDHQNVDVFNIKNYYSGKLYIDDLGFEEKAFNKTEVLGELLFERNRKKVKTFVTTNLKPSEITERYGERIGDRLPEMFNIIQWNGESFRE